MSKSTPSRFVRLLALLGMALGGPSLAYADASCTTMMNSHISWDANGPANLIRFQNVQYVYVKDNGTWTEWSSGTLYWNGGSGSNSQLTSLSNSPLTQLFSDRRNGAQPFNVSAADSTSVTGVDNLGNIVLWDNTWGFSSSFSATCHGNTLTASTSDGTLIMTINDTSTAR